MMSEAGESAAEEYAGDLLMGRVNATTLDKMGKSALIGSLTHFGIEGLRAGSYEKTAAVADGVSKGYSLWERAALGAEILGAFGIRILTAPLPFFATPSLPTVAAEPWRLNRNGHSMAG